MNYKEARSIVFPVWAAGPAVRSQTIDTIGGIAEMWPKDWGWWKSSAEWLAQSATSNMLRLRDTGDELRDRTILLAMVLQASSPKAGGEGR